MRTIDNNGTPIYIADEEYARWSQIFNQEQEFISRMMGIPSYFFERSSPRNPIVIETGEAGVELLNRLVHEEASRFGVTETRGNITESNSERYRRILVDPALPNECYSRNENISTWNGKVLEKVEVFK